jgi:hypothetical protein
LVGDVRKFSPTKTGELNGFEKPKMVAPEIITGPQRRSRHADTSVHIYIYTYIVDTIDKYQKMGTRDKMGVAQLQAQ